MFKKYIQKYKQKKPLAIASDLFLVLLIIIMLVPTWRREVGAVIIKSIMQKPDISSQLQTKLTAEDLDLIIIDEQGNVSTLNQMLNKPVFLTYWATWCHHCVAELPNLERLYNQVQKDVNIIVLVNEELSAVRKYLDEKEVNIPVYQQGSTSGSKLSSKKLPSSFIIDTEGVLRYKETGATKWDSGSFIAFIKNL